MTAEVEAFASSVRRLVHDLSLRDAWRPGTHLDGKDARLTAGLAKLGWGDMVRDLELLPFVGAACLELGRAAVTPHDATSLLGGSPWVKSLAMHGDAGSQVAIPQASGYQLARIESSTPVNFADSLGVHYVESIGPAADVDDGETRMAVWEAAMVGYFAGLAVGVVDLATTHAMDRQIYGKTLAHIPAVQQRIADAATTATALQLSANEGAHGVAALAHASSRTWGVMAHCHLIFGAIGYTLEFPMQRYSRRTKALGSFVDGWIDQQILCQA